MNTITGIIKNRLQLINHIAGFCLLLLLTFCSGKNHGDGTEIIPKSDVQIIHPIINDADVTVDFQGTTRYIQTIQIRAHVTGIISKSFISISDKVSAEQAMFVIKPREATLIESLPVENKFLHSATDTVISFTSGIINQVNVQPGDYVQEGDLLATCVDNQSLRVIVFIPLEMDISELKNKECKVIFPNGKSIIGLIGASLPAANDDDQTNAYLVKLANSQNISENVHVKVNVSMDKVSKGLFVPASAVYSNEELTRHWVLKVANDTLAIRMPIEEGLKKDSQVQIIGKGIDVSDRIVYKGGYALTDSALINIVSSK